MGAGKLKGQPKQNGKSQLGTPCLREENLGALYFTIFIIKMNYNIELLPFLPTLSEDPFAYEENMIVSWS